ncbi:MAG: hypothetical protein A2Y28_01595 [Chlamydiae bacterium GWC2_50_10]|nr:MAG: hypothetical protein A2Z85_03695 [Chlamydiae bacterium GWA2_50_15]OGN54134.1 MAG: hypothetical protein A2Y28_01595 [Chlamydiae bacterium GWC2_50_10]OGN57646.1 MAG: hypothetical protein A3D18_02725 [Chlamydiae bacterium RIFCSPHIGHO2_02_FULL_49_29]OGN64518.1 MAG: hypothetical protein A3E26_02925 [Chlamydiae bacterium RIFCSPHIGHO2_12_FULL_49_32]OGN70681.1 MAG: hypothetical protein A3I15_05765 [Chlamydiae bacterium RIFCSPLOWO2_02_FULL_49_12]OGN72281.1 MAG: hypothetical protein A3G30_04160 
MEKREQFLITQEDAGRRLDLLLASHYSSYSRSYFQYLMEAGAVLLNGSPVKKRTKPRLGDEVSLSLIPLPEMRLEPEAIFLDILFEDEHLIAINKPAGMVVHPAPGHPSHTFVNALLHHCKELPDTLGAPLRPGIVHRLDKETSGVLLAAKSQAAHREIVSLFSERKVKKTYVAICLGNPKDQTIRAPLLRHPVRRKEIAVAPSGKEAVTSIRVLSSQGNYSFVEIAPLTGRTHQIRVHMRHIGAPILGDPVYGPAFLNKKLQLSRQLLHARSLFFIHPFEKRPLEISAPLPAAMRSLLIKFGLD